MLDEELIKLAAQIKIKALQKAYIISTAESCTGGLVSGYLTSIPGSSAYFNTGVVSYANEAKIKLLKVPEEILTKFGAVSIQTAQQMAIGVQNLSNSNISISVTGIAGPDGGSNQKPIGTVCFGLSVNQEVTTYIYHFSGDRNEIRLLATKQALLLILEALA
jgi:PncC family amidohydrolase